MQGPKSIECDSQVAPGDYPSTHKISEAMAAGGAGGCIPIIVLPTTAARRSMSGAAEDRQGALARMLPHTRWLDYCTAVFFVTEQRASSHMAAVLAGLRVQSEEVWLEKSVALRQLRDAFVFRPSSRPHDTASAADYILAEACQVGKALQLQSWRAPAVLAVNNISGDAQAIEGRRILLRQRLAGGDHRRCFL